MFDQFQPLKAINFSALLVGAEERFNKTGACYWVICCRQ